MKNLKYFLLVLLALYVGSLVAERFQDSRVESYKTQLHAWRETSGKWEAVAKKYEDAMSDASYVIGQHIRVLEAARSVECVTREYVKFVDGRRELAGVKTTPLEDKYAYYINNLERLTPVLSKKYTEAKKMQSEVKNPVFFDFFHLSPL